MFTVTVNKLSHMGLHIWNSEHFQNFEDAQKYFKDTLKYNDIDESDIEKISDAEYQAGTSYQGCWVTLDEE